MKRSPDMRRFVPDLATVLAETDPERLAEQRRRALDDPELRAAISDREQQRTASIAPRREDAADEKLPDEARAYAEPEDAPQPKPRSTHEVERVKVVDPRAAPTVQVKRGPWERAAADARAEQIERELAAPPITAEAQREASEKKRARIVVGVALIGVAIAALSVWAGRRTHDAHEGASPFASASTAQTATPSAREIAAPIASPMLSTTTPPIATQVPSVEPKPAPKPREINEPRKDVAPPKKSAAPIGSASPTATPSAPIGSVPGPVPMFEREP